MSGQPNKTKGGSQLKLSTYRIDAQELEEAKAKAEREGMSLSLIIRKMVKNWLVGKYDPFRD